jgi:hypothetical protein
MEPITLTPNVGTCDHTSPEIKASPVELSGRGFLLKIETITCKKCGAVANLVDAAGKQAPSTTIGYFFDGQEGPTRPVASPKAKPVPTPVPAKKPAPEPLGEGPGTELSQELERLGISSCQACKGLARLMNGWGPDGCRSRMDEIVADVLPRARAWFDHATITEKMSVWWNSDQKLSTALKAGTKAASWQLDDALKAVIRVQVEAALSRWEAKQQAV